MELGSDYCYAGGASGSALVSQVRYLESIILVLVACLLAGYLPERRAKI